MEGMEKKERPDGMRTYVERGISRREVERRREQARREEAEAYERSASRRERTFDRSDDSSPTASEADTALTEPTQQEERSPRRTSSGRFNSRRQSRPKREWAEDEQPPLLDTVRDMAERRFRAKQEFQEQYDHSKTGAARLQRERVRGGSAVRDVPYFVPKISGENAIDINYGTRKRKSGNKKPMKMWKKASLTGISLFMVFILCLGMGFNALLNRMNFVNQAQALSMQQQNAAADAEAAAETADVDDTELELPDAVMFDADIENILLIGSDRRNTTDLGRSDAMMMVTIDRKHNKIKMTSFLRDLYIKIPGKYGSKLNAAYAVGGADLLKATIQANLGISVDKYVIVDFTAFKTVVNKIGELNGHGGIKMTVNAAEANYMCHHKVYGNFPRYEKGPGTYYMTGAEALNYARIRKVDSDFGRTNRQRKVLAEIIEELKGIGYTDLVRIAYSCLEYVTTDFTKAELVGLATEASAIMNYDMKQISIPINGSYKTQNLSSGSEVLVANLTVNAEKLAAFIYDDNMTYEGNEKKIVGIWIPDIKGINNSNVTTQAETQSTTAATQAAQTTQAQTQSTTAATP